jgi:hypothetical protein
MDDKRLSHRDRQRYDQYCPYAAGGESVFPI